MRIAFFVPSFPEPSETFILRQITGLIDRGHELRIFAYRPASGGPTHDAVEQYGLRALVRVLPHRNDEVRRATEAVTERPPRWLSSTRRNIGALRCLGREHARAMGGWRTLGRTLGVFATEGPFDIVHCHYGEIGLRYRAAASFWGVPLVVSFYGHDCSSYPRTHGTGVFAPLFAAADAVACLSGHMHARLTELGCPRDLLRRVPLAVDPALCTSVERAPKPTGARVRILTIARLTEKKGIEFGLRALARVVDDFPTVEYHIIGEGPLRAELERLADSLGVRAHVRFLGVQTGARVTQALREADLFLLASVTAANGDQEGTPAAVIEAAYCGLPVLATRHAGIPELVLDGESGYLVPERDHEALADRLRTLLQRPERWPAMGAAGRRHVEASHAIPAVAERLERLYTELRSSPGR
jgi:colanic acid/amylovoran biosynthesis glycosyltransferase